MEIADKTVVRATSYNRYDTGMIGVMSCLLALVGVWMLFSDSFMDQIKGGICALFFVACAIGAIRKSLNVAPTLVFDANGVDYWNGIRRMFIPWGDIQNCYVSEINGAPFLGFRLRNSEKYIDTVADRIEFTISGDSVLMNPNDFSTGLHELVKISNTYLARYGGQQPHAMFN